MPSIKRKYWGFYLLGREERRLSVRDDLSEEAVAKQILEQDEASLPEAVLAACEVAAKSALTPRVRSRFVSDYQTEIQQLDGGDAEEAYQAWCAGRVAVLAAVIEPGVVDALSSMVFEDEG